MTPKQALNIIKKNKGEAFCEAYKELLDIIETALKDYEKQKQLVQTLQDKIYVKEMKYAKQEKALEIIKKCCLLSKYELAFTNKIEISQEEYELLNEVL